MSTLALLPLAIGLALAIGAIAAAVKAPRLPKVIRILAALVFAPLALFSIYGFAASMEPGEANLVWRFLYPAVFLASLSATVRLAFAKSARKPKGAP